MIYNLTTATTFASLVSFFKNQGLVTTIYRDDASHFVFSSPRLDKIIWFKYVNANSFPQVSVGDSWDNTNVALINGSLIFESSNNTSYKYTECTNLQVIMTPDIIHIFALFGNALYGTDGYLTIGKLDNGNKVIFSGGYFVNSSSSSSYAMSQGKNTSTGASCNPMRTFNSELISPSGNYYQSPLMVGSGTRVQGSLVGVYALGYNFPTNLIPSASGNDIFAYLNFTNSHSVTLSTTMVITNGII